MMQGMRLGRGTAIGPIAALALALTGCAISKPPEGPVVPTPQSVTRDNPGGDARDPQYAALLRLRDGRWGRKTDRNRTLDVPLLDAGRWLRVRFWGYPTRAGFRYGKDHWAVAVVSYTDAPEGKDDASSCLEAFLDKALRVAKGFDIVVGELQRTTLQRAGTRARKGQALLPVYGPSPIPVVSTEGHFATFTNDESYYAAVSAHPSWPGTCLVQGFAVERGEHDELARQVAERWVREGLPNLSWRRGLVEAPPRADR